MTAAPPVPRTESDPPRRGRTLRWVALGILLVAAVTATLAVAVAKRNAANTPEALVRVYAAHLPAGRAAAAGELAPPTAADGATLVPGLLSDDVLTAAQERLSVRKITAIASDQVSVGQSAEVAVTYRVGNSESQAVLRVSRLPNTWGVLRHWRIVDTLALPVVIRTDLPGLPAQIGATPVPVSPLAPGSADRRVLLYPGRYHIEGAPSPWLTASVDLPVTHDHVTQRLPSPALLHRSTSALLDRARSEANRLITRCAAAGRAMDQQRCPSAMVWRRDHGKLTVTSLPDIAGLGAYLGTARQTGRTLQFNSMWQPGEFTYSGTPSVPPGHRRFNVSGGVELTEDGNGARIELWGEPYPP